MYAPGPPGIPFLLRKQRGGIVAVAAVGQQRHDDLPLVFRQFRERDRAPERGARRDPDRDAFLPREELRRLEGGLVRRLDDLVIDLRVQHRRHEAGADALDLVRSTLSFRKDGRGLRLQRDDLDGRIHRFQVLPGPGQRAAGADARDEDIHVAVRIPPDLRAGRFAVHFRVGRVGELPRNERPRDLLRQFLRLRDRAFHALRAFRQHELGAVGLQDVPALHAHGLRHRQDDAVALRRRDGREADSCVAARRLDDDGAFLQQALLLGVLDHRLRDAVLDAPCGIEIFQLGQDGRFQPQLLFNIRELNERRIADQPERSFVNI